MRKLTITRAKSFVGCLGTMKVYIEDAEGDTKICDTACRKIGEMKNGETVSLEISEDAAKLYVIADKLSADYCNDCYQIEAGCEDISLTGRNKLNPAVGNAFRFDGNDTPEAKAGRKMGFGKGALVMISAMLIGGLVGYGAVAAVFAIIEAQEKTFEADDMSITLTQGFNEQHLTGYDGVFASKNVDVFILKDSISDGEDADMSPTEYAEYIIQKNRFENCDVIDGDGAPYFVFKGYAGGKEYRYYAYTFKSDGAYWLMQFAVMESQADSYADDIAKWAGSVVFN